MHGQRDESIIDAKTRVRGRIFAQEPLVVRGSVVGEIEADGPVNVLEGAVVRASITASEVLITGVVVGVIRARERIVVGPSGQIRGDLVAAKLRVDAGARIQGNLSVGDIEDLAMEPQRHEPVARHGGPLLTAVPADDEVHSDEPQRRIVVVKKRS
ncbi:MAG: polymer-forming cytoskeletal protein [Myxococcota bacterium]